MREMVPAWLDGVLTPVEKLEAHQRGLRHKAVSVFVVDGVADVLAGREGQGARLLIQRRALGKYHTPGLWANTCCTHPLWDEAGADCARRRLTEEMGIAGLDLTAMGQVEYRAEVGAGMVEHEVVEMFRAHAAPDLSLALNPAEVMDARWVGLADLRAEIAARPEAFTPWLRIYLERHKQMIFG